MSETAFCDDKSQLIDYLYGGLETTARRRFEEHLRRCTACASDVRELSAVRTELATWQAPDVNLAVAVDVAAALPYAQPSTLAVFQPSQSSGAPALQPSSPPDLQASSPPALQSSRPSLPVWAQFAAAVLVGAIGLSIANIQVRYGADGLTVTTGWMQPAAPSAPAAVVAAPVGAGTATASTAADTAADWQPALSALEASLRSEIQAARNDVTTPVNAPAASTRSASGVSAANVTDLIAASEKRQRQELALRLAQFGRDLEVQRRSDLVRINQGFGQFEGRAGAEIARQRQMLDYIMRVSAQPPPQ
ncbi:MAG: zf-HC2 domain-containing protein [Acidobacteria bacterium]|nr:zf-HC2 domain-containing protein [Acidobacteriota bacterium]